MAQTTQIVLTDDLDGSEATRTVTFAFEGASYEIDLNDEHAAAIEESFAEWIAAARRSGGRSTGSTGRSSTGRAAAGPKRTDLDDVRAWARENGHPVADRGRVKQSVLDAYDAAR
ncbi:Lsr2 family protein [uncultured Pseudokineococcus sp.]|uniref:histone-like nucleoid-structuring protein Lsr2 n=1 Tax=uncultured Pseudokineococcus sp. TaxID=1642928 RepID=UPI002612470A|nr:Lsr2 family protein [uncultured Pseudokineococcus sp.]